MIEYLDMEGKTHHLNPDQVVEFSPRGYSNAYIVLANGVKIPTQTPLSDLVRQFNAARAKKTLAEGFRSE